MLCSTSRRVFALLRSPSPSDSTAWKSSVRNAAYPSLSLFLKVAQAARTFASSKSASLGCAAAVVGGALCADLAPVAGLSVAAGLPAAAGCCANAAYGSASAIHEHKIQFRINSLPDRGAANLTSLSPDSQRGVQSTCVSSFLDPSCGLVAIPAALGYYGIS